MKRFFKLAIVLVLCERVLWLYFTMQTNLPPDVGYNVTEIITRHGYPAEIHHVTTDDGYILEMHRIPHGKHNNVSGGPAVFVMSGLWCSSGVWVEMGEEQGLAFLLAERGYDVWMGNARGTTFSRKHVKYNPDVDDAFWQFSFHEMGKYDLPAMIDYARNATNQDKIYFIGHSQGATCYLVMGCERPEYNDKIKVSVLLAPAAFMTNVKNFMLRFYSDHPDLFHAVVKFLNVHELLPHYTMIEKISRRFCTDDTPMTQHYCAILFFLFSGFDEAQFNKTMISVITTNEPAGASVRQITHYMQAVKSNKFQQFDYGKTKNIEVYGSDSPPEYDPSKITSPVSIFFSDNDWMTSEEDLRRVIKLMPNVLEFYRVPFPKWNHHDFMWAIDVVPLVYNRVFEILKNHSSSL